MKRKIFAFFLCLLLCGCAAEPAEEATSSSKSSEVISAPVSSSSEVQESTDEPIESSDLFSARDFEVGYDETAAAVIELSGDSATCSSNTVEISDGAITIKDEGTYILSGTCKNGMIIVNAEKNDKIQLVLNGVDIYSETSAPIYILQADKVFITTADGTQNTLSNSGSYTALDENNIDAVIFSKEDLTLNGLGNLSITSPGGHGIVSKDELTVTSGNYEITSASHGLSGKDNVCIANGDFQIVAGKDGVHAENNDDASLGFVYIENGNFSIESEGDGLSAAATMQIMDGSFQILAGGGSVNGEQKTSDSWGMMGGPQGNMKGNPRDNMMGDPQGNMMGGGMMGDPHGNTQSNSAEEDSTSIKGVKASSDLSIMGGDFTVDSADDAFHSNANLTVSGGTMQIATGDDGFHADADLKITDGIIGISESYEGLEGLSVSISGGDINIVASDDGLNAAGGTDQSGFGGMRGGDKFASAGSSEYFINISGGTVSIQASGDGIDSNGTLSISGGSVTVCGPTMGDTAVLDFEFSGEITGGTFIGTGSYMMAQTFTSSEQGVIAVSTGEQSAGTLITLTDKNGNSVISHEPELPFAIIILCSPDLLKGETYTLSVGSASQDFEAS